MTAGRGRDNVVEVPGAQPRRNEVGRLPCLDIPPPSEWAHASGPPPSARSTRRRARPWRGGSAATRGARSRSGRRASRARRPPPTRAATSASRRRGGRRPSASTAPSRPSPGSRGRRPASRPRTTATARPGWPRRYCRTTSPRYGWVPSPEIEGLRDLAAAHDAATAGLAAAKRRPPALLARRGRAYGGTTPAGNPRRYRTCGLLRWLDRVRPADGGGIRAPAALRGGVEAAGEAREALLAECRAAVAAGPLSAEVEALQSIKGCGSAPAAAFASEVGDFSRFRSGRQATAYFGLAPKRRSSADSVRLGGISGAGNALVRKWPLRVHGATPRHGTSRSSCQGTRACPSR